MNCNNAKQFLYAFADGQLSAKSNSAINEHLQACPDCSHFVEEHRRMRGLLHDEMEGIETPRELKSHIREALGGKHANPAGQPNLPGQTNPATQVGQDNRASTKTEKPKRRRVIFRLRTLAIAALLLIAAGLTWQFVLRPTDAPAAIIAKHALCCKNNETHQHPDLPDRLPGLAAAMAEHGEEGYASIAPKFSRFGYKFESANFCGVKDLECTTGGHLLYVKLAGVKTSRISLFSIPRWEPLDQWYKENVDPENPEPVIIPQSDGPSMCISVWNKDNTSYICCGPEKVETMKRLAGVVRVALENQQTRDMFAALASGQPYHPQTEPRP